MRIYDQSKNISPLSCAKAGHDGCTSYALKVMQRLFGMHFAGNVDTPCLEKCL